jgi:hypothetical protein
MGIEEKVVVGESSLLRFMLQPGYSTSSIIREERARSRGEVVYDLPYVTDLAAGVAMDVFKLEVVATVAYLLYQIL